MTVSPPAPPLPRLSLGVTGHRDGNPTLSANREAVTTTLRLVFNQVEAELAQFAGELAPTRLHSLLADGIDQLAAEEALARGWELVAPLPFGRDLNVAINAGPATAAEAKTLLKGMAVSDETVQARAEAIRAHEAKAHLFELADQDETIAALHEAMLAAPGDVAAAQAFAAHNADQVALAARVMIEQSDLLIGVWDGKAHNFEGGTGHTIATALALGTPVLVIDPARAETWSIAHTPEALAHHALASGQDAQLLAAIVRGALWSDDETAAGAELLEGERWHARSHPLWLGYRAIEMGFGEGRFEPAKLVQSYEPPEAIATGSNAPLVGAAGAIAGMDKAMVDGIVSSILPQFAWADGISTRLSDAYRSGMVGNFLLSALAVLAGLAYQPLGFDDYKWLFAGFEFLILGQIVLVTFIGRRQRWHARWFDTRRIAEYLRHAPVLMLLGVARPPARWPRGKGSNWPEYHARHSLRSLGLPRARLTRAYLRDALETVLEPHVANQRDYHRAKSQRLETVHRRLDRLAGKLFVAAIVSVTIYLAIEAGAALGLLPGSLPYSVSKAFTFLGVAFPTLGASIAAIRFFGDFERFAAISEVTAEKLDAIAGRARLLLDGPADAIDYAGVSELAHAIDEVTVTEIENWQAVFGGKHIALPA